MTVWEVVAGWDLEHSVGSVREAYRQAIREFNPTPSRLTLSQRLAGVVVSSLVHAFGMGKARPAAVRHEPTRIAAPSQIPLFRQRPARASGSRVG